MKPGSRLKSAVCDAEVIVVRASAGAAVQCGGAAMVEARGAPAVLDPAFAAGVMNGKRYSTPQAPWSCCA